MRQFKNETLRSRTRRVAAVLLVAGTMVTAVTAKASITSNSLYVPVQNTQCRYGLSADDLKSVGPVAQSDVHPDVAVRVSIDEHGQVSDAVVEKSSGNTLLDGLALQAARRAQCMPFFGSDSKAVAIQTNFSFDLPRPNAAPVAGSAGLAANLPGAPLSANTGNTSLLAAGVPFELTKPFDATGYARFGVEPGSPKAKMLEDWAKKLASDPDIKHYFSPAGNLPNVVQAGLSRALALVDGTARLSPGERERIMQMTTHALDNAPADCGGVKNLQKITTSHQSMGTESDDVFRAQLDAIFNLMKQATQSTPVPQITAGQRLQGQVALYASIADALKRDPTETEDLGLLMSGKSAELSPEAWCKATRFYQHAFEKTPQPMRDWVMMSELDTQRRNLTTLSTTLKNLAAIKPATQTANVTPKIVDYPERVRQRIRPNIVWDGKGSGLEAVVEVHCASSGGLESVKLVQSSGDRAWDRAALEAVKRSDPMPVDEDGQAPRVFKITLRPGV
ncbi:TonB family protein [Paraburkholderia sp. D15]|uniref:TonB family protein n=1 Tax=Paraburkholderia sp. D15 TaxID=2880218 RepID=UPI00247A4552|nr:TonB family protein [Paraburkholderia sp. D15]WGS54269.1 TonB family protein [Paraburkholderia sp. D15]